jgi:hypothetical protein
MKVSARFRSAALLPLLLVTLLPACRRTPTAPALARLLVETTALPAAVLGEPYAEAVHVQGGDGAYEWEIVAGALPRGLMLTVDDLGVDHGLITGTPERVEVATFTVRVRSGDGQAAERQLSLTVLPEPVAITILNPALPPPLHGASYAVRLRAEGGDQQFTWTVVDGRLPTGLMLSAAGRIEGIPTVVETTTFTVEVRSGAGAVQQTFQLRVVPHDTQRFRITIFAVLEVPAPVMAHVAEAVAEWERAVIGNLPAVAIPETFFQSGQCGGFGPFINGASADDILLVMNIIPIDGPGRVLGQAGPCGVRGPSNLPFAGVMTLDIDDLTPLIGTETLTDIIAHEIAHALGFGSLWRLVNLVQGAGTSDPRFVGPRAVTEWQALGGTGAVPLETEGGEGTAEVHWRKTVFRRELMTGFVEPVGIDQPLSRVSIAAQADLGYSVNMAAANAFSLSVFDAPQAEGDRHLWGELGWDEIYRGPIVVLEPDGSATAIELR